MTHPLTLARAAALCMLALAAPLSSPTNAAAAQKQKADKRTASQKKSGARKNPFEQAKPGASKTQQQTSATKPDGQTPVASCSL